MFGKKKVEPQSNETLIARFYLGADTNKHTTIVTNFTQDEVEWIKSNIGRDAVFNMKSTSINLRFYANVTFSKNGEGDKPCSVQN